MSKILILILLCLLSCNEEEMGEIYNPPKLIDLSLSAVKLKFKNFKFDEKNNLAGHWKKNPGRFSGINDWQNTQITFNTDKELFINESRDSILLNPGAGFELDLASGNYFLEMEIGFLGAEKSSGFLEIYSNGLKLSSLSLKNQSPEIWKKYANKFKIIKNITIKWNSSEGYLFLGHPILRHEDYNNLKPNFIFIVIDAVRADATGFGGFPLNTTPEMDNLAKDSIVFQNNYSNANWTKPSMFSMFYSQYASSLGIGNTEFKTENYQRKIFYSGKHRSLTRVLREAGYFTSAIMNNVFFLDYTGVGFDLGFQEVIQIGKEGPDTEKITEKTIQIIPQLKEPYFLHINYNTPHGPYTPPRSIFNELKKEAIKKNINVNETELLYFAEIRFVDEQLKKIIKALKDSGKFEKTIIAITSDHGELFSKWHDYREGSLTGFRYGHGESLYEEEIKVPFLIKLNSDKEEKVANKIIKNKTSLISLMPTVLSFLDIEQDNLNLKGRDYSSYILGKENQPDEKSIYSEGRMSEALIIKNYKYIRRFPGYYNQYSQKTFLTKEMLEEFYDLTKDKEEKINLVQRSVFVNEAKRELEENSPEYNTFRLRIPPGETTGWFFASGLVYKIKEEDKLKVKYLNNKEFVFTSRGNEIIEIKTVYPLTDFRLELKSKEKELPYVLGKWGIRRKNYTNVEKRFLVTSKEPEGLKDSSIAWIYNDGKVSGEKEFKDQSGIGEEVRSILKSWGYIHE